MHTYDSIVQVAVHECIHIVTDQINPNMDKWLNEGFATYLSGQKSNGRLNFNITFEEFNIQDEFRFGDVGGYALSYYLIDYIKEHYGWDKAIALIQPGNT